MYSEGPVSEGIGGILRIKCPCCSGTAVRSGQQKHEGRYYTVFRCPECEREGTLAALKVMARQMDRRLPPGDR